MNGHLQEETGQNSNSYLSTQGLIIKKYSKKKKMLSVGTLDKNGTSYASDDQ